MRILPPDLLAKIKEQNQTIFNNANPKMSIQVSRAKDTVMDSSYWTTEIIRTKEGIGDLSIAARRLKPYGSPDRLYNIYVDNGIVKTAIREYPDYQKEKWKNQFELGNGSAVAIAFDGYWDLYRKKWQMVTSEAPWLFWVGDGTLYAQYWDDENIKFELSTDVSKVKAIRGWKNINIPLTDQGVICGYIKTDGKVYYRNYAYQETEEFTWENEKQIEEFEGTAINLNMFITNDYRMGFIIEDNLGKVHWLITERAWAGMALKPEYIKAYPYEIKLGLIDLENPKGYEDIYLKAYPYEIDLGLKFALTDNELLLAENKPDENDDWGFIIEFKTKYPIIETLTLGDIDVFDVDKSTTIGIDSLVKIDDYNFRLNVDTVVESGINNVSGDIKIEVAGTYNEAGYLYDDMDITFTPTNLVPTEAGVPEVEAIWNE